MKNYAETALKWADEIEDMWVGTLYESMVVNESQALKSAVEAGEDVTERVGELVQLLHEAEVAYE